MRRSIERGSSLPPSGEKPYPDAGMKPHPRNRKPVRKEAPQQAPDASLVFALAEEVAGAHGVEVLERSLTSSWALRLVLDRDPDPINAGLLTRVIRSLREALAARGLDPGLFAIELESPGARRLLKTPRHLERFAGRQVRVRLTRPRDGRSSILARLLGARDGRPLVAVEDGSERVLEPGEFTEIRLAE
ncbi:MAG: hypothetical protein HY812_10340 [Planctomycetes bacterium]|nr:hypothetical protein [Planctomycetota bacterium]